MATLPAYDIIEPVVAGEIIILNPAEITIGERLRQVDRVHAESLGWSMMKDGQIVPIEVCRLPGQTAWHLAGPGGHRLTGALIVGMNGIECRPVSSSRQSRRLREAVENLFRNELDPIDRAATIAELVQIKRENAGLEVAKHRSGSVRHSLKRQLTGEAETTMETISNVYGWSDELGAELGFTGRTIRNDLMLYRGLLPSLVSRLRVARHPVLRNASQLRALAKLSAHDQATVVGMLVGEGAWEPAKNVAEAIRRINPGKPAVDPAAKRQSTILATLQRMGAAELLGLCQSPLFHRALPAEARRLLAPMLREQSLERTTEHEASAGSISSDRHGLEVGVDRDGGLDGEGRADAVSQRGARRGASPSKPVDDPAMDGGPVPAVPGADPLRLIAGAAKEGDLTALIGAIEDALAADLDPDYVVVQLVERCGADVRFAGGTYELKVARTKATCTAGGVGLLRAWVRAAQRRVEQATALGLGAGGRSS